MTSTRTAVVALAALLGTSCGSVSPVRIAAGDQCYRCRRTIQDTRLAGEVVGKSGFVAKYRAPGCMATYLVAHPDETGTIFVTDYTSGTMINPDRATFVPIVMDQKTGERDYRAYTVKAEAEAAASQLRTTPMTWTKVLEAARS